MKNKKYVIVIILSIYKQYPIIIFLQQDKITYIILDKINYILSF
jgi:hypothetical protein